MVLRFDFYQMGCNSVSKVTVDGANGIGGIKIKEMMKHLGDVMDVTACNDGSSGTLNEGVREVVCFIYCIPCKVSPVRLVRKLSIVVIYLQ